jgi:uncharacterized protein (DUF58 family)
LTWLFADRPSHPWFAVISLILVGVVAMVVLTAAHRARRWMSKSIGSREGGYLGLIGVIAIAALNTGNNLLFIILASLLAGILVSGIHSHLVLTGLEMEFVLPEHVFAEQAMISRVVLANEKWLLPSFSVTVEAKEEKRKKENRRADHPGASSTRLFTSYIPKRSEVTQHVEMTFPRRGRYTQEGFRVSTKFPFGFLKKSRVVALTREILVLPSIKPTEEFYEILPLISGEVESFFKGRGVDLYAIRDYQEGDTSRHVDWKASAKAQQLKVREFTRRTSGVVWCLTCDRSRGR